MTSPQCQELLPNSHKKSSKKSPKKEPYTDTSIYKISKIMLNFQRTYKYQVVRIWNDNLVIASLLDNRAIIKDLIDSNTDSVTED